MRWATNHPTYHTCPRLYCAVGHKSSYISHLSKTLLCGGPQAILHITLVQDFTVRWATNHPTYHTCPRLYCAVGHKSSYISHLSKTLLCGGPQAILHITLVQDFTVRWATNHPTCHTFPRLCCTMNHKPSYMSHLSKTLLFGGYKPSYTSHLSKTYVIGLYCYMTCQIIISCYHLPLALRMESSCDRIPLPPRYRAFLTMR